MTDEHSAEVWRLTVTLLQALPNWDQARLAQEADIDPSQISQYRAGKVVPRRKNRERIAAAVRVSPPLLAQMESFLSGLLAAWKSGGPGSALKSSQASEEDGARAAQIVEQETAQARAELALLGGWGG